MTPPLPRLWLYASFLSLIALTSLHGREERIVSPDGRVVVSVSDDRGLAYRVALDGKPILSESQLGLSLHEHPELGPEAKIERVERRSHEGAWENSFGARRHVPDRYEEARLSLREGTEASSQFNLVVRAYDHGIAFSYEIPVQEGLEEFIIDDERTEFVFPEDWRCWAGDYNGSAENQYPEKHLTQLARDGIGWRVLPLLVETPHGYAAIAEADLLDWAGMFVAPVSQASDPKPRPGVKVALDTRHDGRGCVVVTQNRRSPWRVVLLARQAKDLLLNDLVATLATPSRIADTSWIKPGISAWDVWWTGVNPTQPEHTGVFSRGDTRSHREFIDFASEMGFRYQLMDWFWYEHMTSWEKGLNAEPNTPSGDFTRALPFIDVPGLVAYGRDRGVGLWIWAHSLDIKTFGMERALKHLAGLGVVGIKVDFFSSDSQETVQWVVALLECAARHRLMVDLHGIYKPTGLARTYPNFLTQEGVLGNEYNKLRPGACSTLHEITLPFTRALLGPMDFTPGGFLNRTAADFQVTSPAQVVGTRARQLAMTVMYPSPLLVVCDSPSNYRGQPGVEFFRGLPTVWDESVALAAEVAGHAVVARRSGERWYLAGMNGEQGLTLRIPLDFLGKGRWSLRSFADTSESGTTPTSLRETIREVSAGELLELTFAPAGGYAAVLTPLR